MPSLNRSAATAYRAAAAKRSIREQEADVFRQANAMLRTARQGTAVGRAQAVADNRQLWITIDGLMRDPENALPADLRAAIASIGRTVQREMERDEPDFDFLIAINENMAAGLAGKPSLP